MSTVLCVDLGNTTAHWGRFEAGKLVGKGGLPEGSLAEHLPDLLDVVDSAAVSWCSVSPAATDIFEEALAARGIAGQRLTCADAPGLKITYPKPQQVGQDRLANAIGAQVLTGPPAVVIDMGTATTFDLVTSRDGFIGGVIAPGFAAMTNYLHEKVAMLPRLTDKDLTPESRVGRSTLEGMSVACTRGYPGMIRAILVGVFEEFRELGEPDPTVLLTGGASRGFLREALAEFRSEPDLTLQGLHEAWRRRSQLA